jgi:hypothetical protein
MRQVRRLQEVAAYDVALGPPRSRDRIGHHKIADQRLPTPSDCGRGTGNPGDNPGVVTNYCKKYQRYQYPL